MFGIKVILTAATLSSAICCLLLVWFAEETTCEPVMLKVWITSFFVSTLVLTKEVLTFKYDE